MQSIVQSPTHDNDPTFSLAIWVGTIGGSALPTDTAPNTSAPSAARVLQISPRKGAMLMHGSGVLRLCCGVVGSSSITIQSWFFDNTQALWIQFGAPVVITPTGAASNTSTQTISNVAGAKFFLQITANTLVQAFGYDFG
jgi:hypothetical protein